MLPMLWQKLFKWACQLSCSKKPSMMYVIPFCGWAMFWHGTAHVGKGKSEKYEGTNSTYEVINMPINGANGISVSPDSV